MSALEKLLQQVRELFSSMTPSARIISALMAGVIIVSMGWILSNQQSSKLEYLFGGQQFTEDQLNTAEKALGEAGLRQYEREGARIKIPTAERDLYLKALAEGGAVPKEWGAEIEKALNSGNPFEAQHTIDRRFANARQVELARMIEQIDGIERAMVSYDEKRSGFGRNATQVASIGLRGTGGRPIDMELMRRIADSATTYFAGLRPENVTVFDLKNGGSYRGSSDPNVLDQQPYIQAVRSYEAKYKREIAQLLRSYGDVEIGIGVELDPTLKRETEKVKFDPVGTATETTTTKKDTKSAKPLDGGRPGAEPNTAFAMKPASVSNANQQTAESKESSEDQKSVIGHEASLVKEAPLTPKRISVTIGVSEGYFTKLWLQRYLQTNPGKTVKDLPAMTVVDRKNLKDEAEANIRGLVEGILPSVREGDDRHPLVTVVFNPEIPLPPVAETSVTQTAMTWFGTNWSTVGLFGLVGFSLMMMFNWVKAQAPSEKEKQFQHGFGLEVPSAMSVSLELGDEEKPSNEEDEDSPAFQITGGEIKEELSSLVKSNPDAAVNLLRTWIGDAA
ncbi:MAG: hypothetical protein U0892_14630 [Pirellulales bacterium]